MECRLINTDDETDIIPFVYGQMTLLKGENMDIKTLFLQSLTCREVSPTLPYNNIHAKLKFPCQLLNQILSLIFAIHQNFFIFKLILLVLI